MKKCIISIIILAFCVIIYSSCSSEFDAISTPIEISEDVFSQSDIETSNSNEDSSGDSDVTDYVSDSSYNNVYDSYYLLYENDPFVLSMKDNPIDKYAECIMENRSSTSQMMEGLTLIFEKWESEMRLTIIQLCDVLSERKLDESFLDSQQAWESTVDACLDSDKEIISANEWATELPLMFMEKRIELYKNRTIHLKYLLYLYTTDSDDYNDSYVFWFSTFEESDSNK
jgi:hypothetical protein